LDLCATGMTKPNSTFSSEIWWNVLRHYLFRHISSSKKLGRGRKPILGTVPQFNKDHCSSVKGESESRDPGHWNLRPGSGLLAYSLGKAGVRRTSCLLCVSFLWIEFPQRHFLFSAMLSMFLLSSCVSQVIILLCPFYFPAFSPLFYLFIYFLDPEGSDVSPSQWL